MEKEIKRVTSNSIWLLLESIITMLISLVVGMISARYLGPNNYGLINKFIPFISLANSICTFGMQSIITREVSRTQDDGRVSLIIGSAVRFRLLLSAVAFIAINLYALYCAKSGTELLLWISIIQSVALLFNVYEIFTYWFHARLLSKYLAIATVCASVIIGAWKVMLLIFKADVIFFAMSTTMQSIIMFVIILLFFKKNFKVRLSSDKDTTRFLIKDSYHLLLTSLGVAIYGQIDKIMIGAQLNATALGL